MKFKVELAETSEEVNTYIYEAESEEAIRMDLHDGNEEGMIELIETLSENRIITDILSVKPYQEPL
jgi:hypothetical protein